MNFLKEYKALKKIKKYREENCLITMKKEEKKLQESINKKSILEKTVEVFHNQRLQNEYQVFKSLVHCKSVLSLKELNDIKHNFQIMKEREMKMKLEVQGLAELVQKNNISYKNSCKDYNYALHNSFKIQKLMSDLSKKNNQEQEYKEGLEIEDLIQLRYSNRKPLE